MKILIYGAGVLGGYLAHSLVQSGNDVSILARGKRYDQLKNNGLVIRHYFQRKTTIDRVNVVNCLEEDDFYDIIFVVMKYNQFSSVLPILAKNISKNVVFIGNNADPQSMQSYLEDSSKYEKNIAFGFQISAGRREDSGIVVSIHGSGDLIIGELHGNEVLKPTILKAFNNKYKVTYHKDIDSWLKSHFALILGINSIQYINNDDFKKISKDNKQLNLTIDATDEALKVLEILGYKIMPEIQAKLVRQYRLFYLYGMKLYYKLPMSNISSGSFSEVVALYETFDLMKKQANIQTPSLDLLQNKALKMYYKKTICD